MAVKIVTTCSGCREDVTLRGTGSFADIATVTVKGEGRGSLRVQPKTLIADVVVDGDEALLMWDCPACGYADSYDLTQD